MHAITVWKYLSFAVGLLLPSVFRTMRLLQVNAEGQSREPAEQQRLRRPEPPCALAHRYREHQRFAMLRRDLIEMLPPLLLASIHGESVAFVAVASTWTQSGRTRM